MKAVIKACGLLLALALCAAASLAQTPPVANGSNDPRVPLAEAATAADADGRLAIGGRLRTTTLTGAPDAPTRNVLFVVDNRGQFFYNYASGYASFYDAQGVRCGEGLWTVQAFAPGESAEVDAPGLRLTCAPATWRLTALNLLTRTFDVAKPNQPTPAADAAPASGVSAATAPTLVSEASSSTASKTVTINNAANSTQRLEINVNGMTLPLQLGNPLEIVVGKERVRLVVSQAPPQE